MHKEACRFPFAVASEAQLVSKLRDGNLHKLVSARHDGGSALRPLYDAIVACQDFAVLGLCDVTAKAVVTKRTHVHAHA